MRNVSVVLGDISRVPADALITAINSGGMWYGGIDGVIQRNAGDHFHGQAAAVRLKDGMAVVAKGAGGANRGAFKNVVFVVDDLQKPLRQIVFAGLEAAEKEGYKTVTLPTVRMGVMLGAVEKSVGEAISEMHAGVEEFFARHRESAMKITFVVYNAPEIEAQLKVAFAS